MLEYHIDNQFSYIMIKVHISYVMFISSPSIYCTSKNNVYDKFGTKDKL